VLAYLSRRADERTVEAMEKEAGDLRIRDRIALGVKLRIQNTFGGKESVRRGLALLALPFNGPLALRLLYRTVDAIWYAAGDTSTDFNFYSKRALLSGVFSSTLLYWLNDRSEGDQATWDFLARRIDDVMRFEKLKSDLTSGPRQAARHS
jgi:ubiquinone biosynthesis protein COQ9